MEQGSIPGPDNAWFTSKVVSRHHATIKAHPRSMILTIEDNNSMHGTYLNGLPVKREQMELLEHDVVTFGTDIVRHSETFSPLKTRITYEWIEEDSPPEAQPRTARNTFTADFSDQDIFSDIDDDLEIVKESVRQPSVEVLQQSPFTKPAAAPSSTTSPSANSTKSTSASSATTTRIDLSDDEETFTAKTNVTSKNVINLEDLEESDMDDYPISQSEEISLSDMEDSEREPSEGPNEQESLTSPAPLSSAQEKSPREPSPSDAALPGLRPVPPPRIQSVPSFASLMPPPPPSFISPLSSDGSFRSSMQTYSPFLKNFCGTSQVPGPYQSTSSPGHAAPFGYDFTTMNPPSPLRTANLASMSSSIPPAWTYPSIQVPQPPTWAEHDYRSSEDLYHPLKRKADEISIDSDEDDEEEEESDTELPVPTSSKRCEDESSSLAPLRSSPSFAPDSPSRKEADSTTETTVIAEHNAIPADPSVPSVEAAQASSVEAAKDAELLFVESEVIEPPRKRVRITVEEPERKGSTIRAVAKYTATASAGAIVGAVGVIIGLASLPPDYFA